MPPTAPITSRNGPNIRYGSFLFDPISGYPTPQVSISQSVNRSSAGVPFSYASTVTLEGIIYAFTGYNNDCSPPNSLDQDGGFSMLMKDASGLSSAFRKDFQELTISCNGDGEDEIILISGDGTGNQITKVNSINFNTSQDYWAVTVPYTIEISVISASGFMGSGSGYPSGGGFYISSFTDNLSINVDTSKSYYITSDDNPVQTPFKNPYVTDNNSNGDGNLPGGTRMTPFSAASGYPTYTVSRTVGAAGIQTSGLNSVKNAQDWVINQLSVFPITGMTSGLDLYNRETNITADAAAGTYQVVENYVGVPIGNSGFLETFEVSQDISSNGTRSLSINGNIQGLENNSGEMSGITGGYTGTIIPTHTGVDAAQTKYRNALSGYLVVQDEFFSRVVNTMPYYSPAPDMTQFFSSENWVNPVPVTKREGFNPAQGSISYNWSYDNRPLALISGAQGERLDVNDNYSTRSVANVYVIGRRLGPVTQDLGTYTKPKRRVTYSARFPKPSGFQGYSITDAVYNSVIGTVSQYDPALLNPGRDADNNPVGPIISNITNDSYSFNPIDASVSYTVEWEYTRCAS